jgi:hypothetical protein
MNRRDPLQETMDHWDSLQETSGLSAAEVALSELLGWESRDIQERIAGHMLDHFHGLQQLCEDEGVDIIALKGEGKLILFLQSHVPIQKEP